MKENKTKEKTRSTKTQTWLNRKKKLAKIHKKDMRKYSLKKWAKQSFQICVLKTEDQEAEKEPKIKIEVLQGLVQDAKPETAANTDIEVTLEVIEATLETTEVAQATTEAALEVITVKTATEVTLETEDIFTSQSHKSQKTKK